MTTMLEARAAITTEFSTEYNTTDVSWPNKAFSEPTDGSAWVQFNIDFFDSLITTISVKNNEQLGAVMVNVFTGRYSGTIESTTLAQEIRAIFNRERLGDILFEPPTINEVPTPVDNNWFQRLVRVNFSYYEFIP